MDSVERAQAFAALEAIRSGGWDDVLPELRIAVWDRCERTDFKAKVLARAEFRAGVPAPSAGGSTPDPADIDPRKLDADIALGVWQKGGSAYRCDVDGTDGNPRPCTHRDCWDSGDEEVDR